MSGGEPDRAAQAPAEAPVARAALTDAQRALAAAHKEVVEDEARKLAAGRGGAVGFDELAGYGHKGLVEAARTFNNQLGVPFKAHAIARVRWAMWDGIREELPHLRALATAAMRVCDALDRPACGSMLSEEQERSWVDECEETAATAMLAGYTWSAARKTEEAVVERDAVRRGLEALAGGMAMLTAKDRAFLDEHYKEERTIVEIAATRQWTYDHAKKLHRGLLKRLSKYVRAYATTGQAA